MGGGGGMGGEEDGVLTGYGSAVVERELDLCPLHHVRCNPQLLEKGINSTHQGKRTEGDRGDRGGVVFVP